MPVAGAVIGAAGAIGGGLIGSSGAKSAAKTAAKADAAAIAEQRRQFDISTGLQKPWWDTGVNALGDLAKLRSGDMSQFQTSPGYQWRLQQGQSALDNSAAARGGALSGNAIRASTEFGQNLGSNEFANYLAQLNSEAGIGQSAANQSGQYAMQTGANIGNLLQDQGNARASGIASSANVWGNALGGAANALGGYLGNRGGYSQNSVYGGNSIPWLSQPDYGVNIPNPYIPGIG